MTFKHSYINTIYTIRDNLLCLCVDETHSNEPRSINVMQDMIRTKNPRLYQCNIFPIFVCFAIQRPKALSKVNVTVSSEYFPINSRPPMEENH